MIHRPLACHLPPPLPHLSVFCQARDFDIVGKEMNKKAHMHHQVGSIKSAIVIKGETSENSRSFGVFFCFHLIQKSPKRVRTEEKNS